MRTKVLKRFLMRMHGSKHMHEGEALLESYTLFPVLFDQALQYMSILKPDGTLIKINQTAVNSLQDKGAEIIGKPFWEAPWWTDSPEQQERLRAAFKTATLGEFVSFEATYTTAEGKTVYMDFSLKPVKDTAGSVVLLVAEGRDITERKQTENAVRESEWKFRAIFNQNFQMMGILSVDGTIMEANKTALELSGVEESEVKGKPFWEAQWWTHSTDLQNELRSAIKTAAAGESVNFEATHMAADGTLHDIEFSLKPVKDEAGKVIFLVPEGRDITDQKRAEEALRESAVKYRIIADNTYNWEFWLSPQNRFLYSSPSCRRITGHEAEEFNANPELILSLIHPDDRNIWTNHRHDVIDDVTQPAAQREMEFRMLGPNGDIRWIHHICMPVFDENGNFLGTRGSFEDITKRKLAEEKNLRLADIVESSDDAIIGKTVDGIITSWNKGAEKIFGYNEKEVLGKPVAIIYTPDYKDEMLKVYERIRRGEHIEHFEIACRKKDGEPIDMSLTYSPIKDAQGRVVAVSTTGRDITARNKAAAALLENARINQELELHEKELLLLRQSRLAAMGEMIGNIAHQWRQPLNLLGLIAQELSMTYKKGDFSAEYLDASVKKMLENINYMSKTIDDFRDFIKPGKEKVDFRILEIIKKNLSLMEVSLKAEQIKTEVVSACDPVVNGYPNELSQALLNIMINARDAFVRQKVATPAITIEISMEGDRCVVTVTDNAGGIPAGIIDKVFDPYFSTKGPEQGTGLGLYMSKTIIEKNMGGSLSVRNVDGGAQFRVVL